MSIAEISIYRFLFEQELCRRFKFSQGGPQGVGEKIDAVGPVDANLWILARAHDQILAFSQAADAVDGTADHDVLVKLPRENQSYDVSIPDPLSFEFYAGSMMLVV